MSPRRGWSLPLAAVLLVVLSACSGSKPSAPVADDPNPAATLLPGTQSFPGLSHDHARGRQQYAQTPPAGGPHWPPRDGQMLGWQRCGVYTEPVVNEFAVHSLEHGAVWITYLPTATPDQRKELEALRALNPAYVLVSPYPGQPKPFMATAWGAQVSTDRVDDPLLPSFTKLMAGGGQGGEAGADCANGATLAQAQAAVAAVR